MVFLECKWLKWLNTIKFKIKFRLKRCRNRRKIKKKINPRRKVVRIKMRDRRIKRKRRIMPLVEMIRKT